MTDTTTTERRGGAAAVSAAVAGARTWELVEELRYRLAKQAVDHLEAPIDLSPIESFMPPPLEEEDSTARRDERDRIAGEFDDVADRVLWRDLDGVLIGLERIDDRFHALRSLVREQGSCV